MHRIVTETHRIKFPFLSGDELQCFFVDLRKLQQMSFNNVFFFSQSDAPFQLKASTLYIRQNGPFLRKFPK